MNHTIAFVFLICFAGIALGAPIEETISKCWKNHSHVEMSQCVLDVATKAHAELKSAEQLVVAAISKKDEPSEHTQAMRSALEASNLSYRKYQQSQCNFEAAFAAGGNAAHDLRTACNAELDRNRTEQLQAWAQRGAQ
jgi:uncharacterized protein YecT (DUF1311 family)